MLEITIAGLLSFIGKGILIIGYISNNSLFPEALSQEEERIYVEKMINGDENAKKILIEHNLRLVAHVCKKYSNSKVEQDDLISIGSVGLIKGINTYNPNKSIKLSTYISKCIDNEILMHFRSTKKLNNEIYLEETIGKDKDENVITLKDIIENDDRPIEEEIDLKLRIKELYQKVKIVLCNRERRIIESRYGLNGNRVRTQREIAKELGISRSYVSRIETKAIEKLSREFKKNYDNGDIQLKK